MFIRLKVDGLHGASWKWAGSVLEVDDQRGNELVSIEHAANHPGPAFDQAPPPEPEPAPKKGRKPAPPADDDPADQ